MDLTASQRKTLALYGPAIQAAATVHMNTADLWSTIRDVAEAEGLASPGVRVQDVSHLRGIFGGMTRAAEALQNASGDQALSASMIGQAPWSPDVDVQAATPAYLATFQLTRLVDGVPVTDWAAVRIPGALPGTVGQLQASLEADAMAMAAEAGGTFYGEFQGIDSIALQAIAPR